MLYLVKFVFSKKATKIDEIFTVDLTVKISSIFVAFLENTNFKNEKKGSTIGNKLFT